MRITSAIVAVAMGLGCRSGERDGAAATPPPTPPPAPTSTATPAPDATPPPAATVEKPAPVPVPVTAAVAIVDGRELPLAREGVTLVDAGASYRVEVNAHLVDGRLALHDELDAMVASKGTAEADGRVTRYHLAPLEPLVAGTSYTLVVDGAVTRESHDGEGRAFTPVVVHLKTVGEKPAPARKRKKR